MNIKVHSILTLVIVAAGILLLPAGVYANDVGEVVNEYDMGHTLHYGMDIVELSNDYYAVVYGASGTGAVVKTYHIPDQGTPTQIDVGCVSTLNGGNRGKTIIKCEGSAYSTDLYAIATREEVITLRITDVGVITCTDDGDGDCSADYEGYNYDDVLDWYLDSTIIHAVDDIYIGVYILTLGGPAETRIYISTFEIDVDGVITRLSTTIINAMGMNTQFRNLSQ